MRFARFLVVGVANTAVSYGVYLVLLLVIDYRIAYTVAYVAGSSAATLRTRGSCSARTPGARSALAYLATYAAMYLASLLVLYLAVDFAGVPKPLAMLAALFVTVPASFLLLRRGFAKRS